MKIQNVIYKNLIFFCIIYFLPLGRVTAQDNYAHLLQEADSLYTSRNYTESLQIYEQLYRQEHVYSPAMLLKMAFIQEGLGEYSETLYYLNEYFLQTSNEMAIDKMQEISKKYGLQGYQYSDYDIFLNVMRKYRYPILYGIIFLILGGLIYFSFNRKNYQSKPYGIGIAYAILLGFLFFLTNFNFQSERAIITSANAYIMDGPSSGAQVVAVSKKGDRVKVAGKEDVWTRIQWDDGQEAFIRENNLRMVR